MFLLYLFLLYIYIFYIWEKGGGDSDLLCSFISFSPWVESKAEGTPGGADKLFIFPSSFLITFFSLLSFYLFMWDYFCESLVFSLLICYNFLPLFLVKKCSGWSYSFFSLPPPPIFGFPSLFVFNSLKYSIQTKKGQYGVPFFFRSSLFLIYGQTQRWLETFAGGPGVLLSAMDMFV